MRNAENRPVIKFTPKNEHAVSFLKECLEKRELQTEETSLKFSNITPEEMALWREGRPTPEFRYELSFWSDLAKWLLVIQDENPEYHVDFEYGKDELPTKMTVVFEQVDIIINLDEKALSAMIPALNSIKTPLTVYSFETDAIEKIAYNEEKSVLTVTRKEKKLPADEKDKKGISFAGWHYIPRKGFYLLANSPQSALEELSGHDISKIFTEYPQEIKKFLKGTTLSQTLVEPSYHLYFDDEWNLHMDAYLFEPHDLQKKYSRIFDG